LTTVYVTHAAYLQASQAGATRIDLQGQPAGVVTAEEAQDAVVRLKRIRY
jgi:sRNA-binding protein